MWGIFIADDGFEIMCVQSAIGRSRHLHVAAVSALEGFLAHYTRLLSSSNHDELLKLGGDLYDWLDGDGGQLHALMQQAPRPLRFEVCAARRNPSKAKWALMRAPWELLAFQHEFLASDAILGFSPTRRLRQGVTAPALDKHRLGLVFMAASPWGARELDHKAEETAIVAAVGPTKLDLLVEPQSGGAWRTADGIRSDAGAASELPRRQCMAPAGQADGSGGRWVTRREGGHPSWEQRQGRVFFGGSTGRWWLSGCAGLGRRSSGWALPRRLRQRATMNLKAVRTWWTRLRWRGSIPKVARVWLGYRAAEVWEATGDEI